MSAPLSDFDAILPPILSTALKIKGWLTPREIRFLSFIMAHPSTNGRFVEIGSYHGKSTVVLAMASELVGNETLIAVDPIEATPLQENLERFGVSEKVQFFNTTSDEFWLNWEEPIRVLWHDGANDREIVDRDVESAIPWLGDGAIVAFHDILNLPGERIHVYIDKVLRSPHFGASGIVGSIGWSQYCKRPEDAVAYQPLKARLRRKLERLRPFANLARPPEGRLSNYRYKLFRWLVPHSASQMKMFMRQVQFQP